MAYRLSQCLAGLHGKAETGWRLFGLATLCRSRKQKPILRLKKKEIWHGVPA